MKLEEAIQQPKFSNKQQKVGINLLYTASWFNTELSRALKCFGITWQQFNIMRILRGQGENAVSLKLVSCRMIDRMSNTSRLVDKLVLKGLVSRQTSAEDRRHVAIALTAKGKELLQEASTRVESLSFELFGHMAEPNLAKLNQLLDDLRGVLEHESNYIDNNKRIVS